MQQNTKEIRNALLGCVPYFLIIFFLDDLDRLLCSVHSHLGNLMLALYMIIGTVIILSMLIHSIKDFKSNCKEAGNKAIWPFVIYAIAILNSNWSPLRISSEIFHSKITHRAYRKSSHGYDNLKMHEDGKFDIRYQGPIGMSDWQYGIWHHRGDTFYLQYETGYDTAALKPDTLALTADGVLVPVGIPADTLTLYRQYFFRMRGKKKS